MLFRGYEVGGRLHESNNTVVLRAHRQKDRRPVILKMLRAESTTVEALDRLRREFELTRKARGSGVIEALDLLESEGNPALVLEDMGGISLEQHWRSRRPALREAIDLGIQVASALAGVHRSGVIHKDINPSNLLIDPASGQIKLIDFGLSTALHRETIEANAVGRLEGTLAYIAPEQTGRINRGVDSRADLYALGVTLFEAIEGRLPFASSDPLELVHAHIAVRAPALGAGVPALLAAVVERLLAKLPEERYQTAEGVRADLERLRAELSAGKEPEFPLGTRDFPEKLRLPERLYGRDAPREALLAAIDRINGGSAEWLGVEGPSGIGKSRLIAEVLRPLLTSRGHLGAGKHDQIHRQRPCAGVTAALRQCVRQILGESPERLAHFQGRIRAELGAEARLVVDEIPELGVLLGETEPVAPLTGQEAQNRFVAVMRRLVGALAAKEHPLVLFLDDLQWADATTFRLLGDFLVDPEARHLLLLAAYRDDEVDALHPMASMLAEMRSQGVAIGTLRLAPLDHQDAGQFIADALRRPASEVSALADILLQKTGGNPFFLGQLLRSLHERGYLRLDPGQGKFVWSEAELRRVSVAENVVALMTASLSQLPAASLGLVKLAACLGAEFSLGELVGTSPRQALDALGPALEAGHVEPLGELVGASPEARFRFVHDRIQQAAYSLLDEQERVEAHLALGRALARLAGEHPEQSFAAADHLNRALGRLDDPTERRALAALNLAAGRKASAAGVFDAAFRYLSAGLEALPGDEDRQAPAGLALCIEAAEAALLSGDREACSRLVGEAVRRASSPLDKARAMAVRVGALATELPMSKALDLGLEALALLGVSIPRDTGKGGVLKTFGQLRLALRRLRWRLDGLPALRDERLQLAARLLTRLQGVSFEVSPDLFMVAAFRLLLLSLEHGVAPSTPPALGTVAIVLGPAFGDWENALRCREQAYALLQRPECASALGFCHYTFAYFIDPWVYPLRDALPPLLEGVRASMGSGDYEATGYLLFAVQLHRIAAGDSLAEIAAEIPAAKRRLRRVSPLAFEWLRAPFQAVENLLGDGAADPWVLEGTHGTVETFAQLERSNNRYGLALHRCQRVHLLELFGRHDEALSLAAEVDRSADVLLGQVYLLRMQAYAAMAGYALAASSPPLRRAGLLAKAAWRQRSVEAAARRAPFNFQQLAWLLRAERALALGDPSEAISAYERAIAAARDSGAPHDEALACERLGRLFFHRGSASAALAFLRSARLAYLRWGARAKARQLERDFPALVVSAQPALDVAFTTSLSTSISSSTIGGKALDFRSLMKASHAVSSELSLDSLLPRFARIALENAGAHRCLLFLSRHDGLALVASAEGAEPPRRHDTPFDQASRFARGAVAYVARTARRILVDDANTSENWASDPHLLGNNIRSLLVLPLRHQGRTIGVLYLEGGPSGAFSAERVEVLELLSSQAGSAVENALLYASLEQKVQERTAALSDSLQQVIDAQKKLADELSEASAFVRSLLPAPLGGPIRSSWLFEPSAALGGDGLGYQWLDDRRLAVYLLDVCGHGVKPCLLSISILTSLNARRLPGVDFSSPSAVLGALNDAFRSADHGWLFFTLWYGVVDLADGQIRYASAGHPPAVLLRPGEPPAELNTDGPVIGMVQGLTFEERTTRAPPGSRLVVFSDGVYEIERPDGRILDYDEFADQLARTPEGALASLLDFARQARGAREFDDDFSIVELAW